ncbi:MAG: YybH family protein, partial [Candidatus Binataceae bacterium]
GMLYFGAEIERSALARAAISASSPKPRRLAMERIGRSFLIAVAVGGMGLVVAAAALGAGAPAASGAAGEIKAATAKLYIAINAAINGDTAPIDAAWLHSSEATDFGTHGGRAMGWNTIIGEYKRMGRLNPAGKVTPGDVVVGASGDMGYSVCDEEREAQTAGGQNAVVRIRATNIFRREDGQWKLVHRHVDPLADVQPASQR